MQPESSSVLKSEDSPIKKKKSRKYTSDFGHVPFPFRTFHRVCKESSSKLFSHVLIFFKQTKLNIFNSKYKLYLLISDNK